MGKLIIGIFVLLLCSCRAYREIGALERKEIKDSVMIRTDTVWIDIQHRAVEIVIDTLIMNDTVQVYNSDSLVYLKYWRNKYGQLQAQCMQASYKQKEQVQVMDKVRIETIYRDRILEVEKEVLPIWVWIGYGLIGLISIMIIIKR